MGSSQKFLLFVISILVFMYGVANSQEPSSGKFNSNSNSASIVTNSNSSITILGDPSNAGSQNNSVNLYTGQHTESFSLISVPGKNGLGVSLSLDYNGSVSSVAKSENRKAQASPFGLGFSLGLESIICEHNGTTTLEDDKYKLLLGNTALDLIVAQELDTLYLVSETLFVKRYITQNGLPWNIHPIIHTISSRDYVTGWIIVREDGTIYCYGDAVNNFDSLNATRNILSYGDFVGSGVTTGDEIFPFQWDLKEIHDFEELNWIKFSYLRDSSYLKVNCNDTLGNSDNSYSSASYIDKILLSNNKSIQFNYISRTDRQTYYGLNVYEFLYSKRIRFIRLYNDTEILSTVNFSFDYLNNGSDSTLQKLLLKNITQTAGSGQNSLPSIYFEYDMTNSSLSYGSVKKVFYPSGKIKELHYSVFDTSKVFTSLNTQIITNASSRFQNIDIGENIFVTSDTNGTTQFGYWNGYWDIDTSTAYRTLFDNPAIVSSDGWGIVYDSLSNRLISKRWQDGYWVTDTIQDTIVKDWDVNLYVGDNSFIVTTGLNGSPSITSKKMKRAYYYRYRNNEWKGFLIADGDFQLLILGVKLIDDTYAISAQINTKSHLFMGKYDASQDTVIFPNGTMPVVHKIYLGSNHFAYDTVINFPEVIGPLPSWEGVEQFSLTANKFVVEKDLVAYADKHNVHIYRWNYSNSQWDNVYNSVFGDNVTFIALTPHPNGLSMAYYVVDGGNRWLNTLSFTNSHTTFEQTPMALSSNMSRMWSTNNTIAAQNEGYNSGLWRWDGLGWDFDGNYIATGNGIGWDLHLLPDHYIWSTTGNSARLEIGRNIGNQSWTDEFFTLDNVWSPFISNSNSVLIAHNRSFKILYYDPFINSSTYQEIKLDSIPWSIDSTEDTYVYAAENNYVARIYYPPSTAISEAFAYKKVNDIAMGKPSLLVIDSVSSYKYADDPSPIIQSYNYYGGILDQSGHMLRFAKVSSSTPYFKGDSPEGYVVQYFYNDIDENRFQYQNIFNSDTLLQVDLIDSTLYNNIPNGGYHLDGMTYITYSYSVGDPSDMKHDFTRNFYSLYQSPDSVFGVYRTKLDSSYSRKDSLDSYVFYQYDEFNNQPNRIRTQEKIQNNVSYYVDSIIYAYLDNSISMKDENAIIQPFESIRYYDSDTNSAIGDTILSRSRVEYEKHGSWKSVRNYSWSDLSDTTSIFKTSEITDFDIFGNAIVNVNLEKDTSFVKYDSLGIYPIVTGSICSPGDIIAQDFEQNETWDDWNIKLFYSNVSLSDDTVFTGKYSYNINDDINSTGRNWGAERYISVDSLTSEKYYFSCWVRSNYDIRIYCWGLKSDSSTCEIGRASCRERV